MPSLDRLAGFHIRWKSAGEEVVGRLQDRARDVYMSLSPWVEGVVVVSTCNRFEVYIDAMNPLPAKRALEEALPVEAHKALEETRGIETVLHLMRVTAGLDSAILGEHEVLGQVREAWLSAKSRGSTTWLLDQVFHRALVAGRRARSETGIGRGRVGYPEVAVDIAAERLRGLDGASVAVVGAGSAARGILLSLCARFDPETVTVYNKSINKAVEAARICSGRAYSLESLGSESFDVMFVAVSGGYRLPETAVSRASLVIDISNPPAAFGPNVVGFSEVTRVARERIEMRRRWIPMVMAIIEEEVARLREMLRRSSGDKVAGVVMRYAYSLIEAEVDATLRNLGKGRSERESLEVAFESYARKVLHPLLSALRRASLEGRHDLIDLVAREYGGRMKGEEA